ncbi:MAG: type I methionyl aminopeptidase [Firmicutes bacterium]|nr:type I methionyl aminopeptidase [Bacillota bacterium]
MIQTYNEAELEIIRAGGKILARTHEELARHIRAGISTLELDKIAEKFIRDNNAEPAFKGFNRYPYSICASVNEESIHGMPRGDKILREGDIISIDIGLRFKGFCTDAARTHSVGAVSEEAKKLIEITEKSFWRAIKDLKAKSKVGDIGDRVEDFVRNNSTFSIIETYFGHGIGRSVHQDPLIPNFRADKKIRKLTLQRLPLHCVICIEPMINVGDKEVEVGKDGWTVRTKDGSLAAHYENTVIILQDGVEVVTI